MEFSAEQIAVIILGEIIGDAQVTQFEFSFRELIVNSQ